MYTTPNKIILQNNREEPTFIHPPGAEFLETPPKNRKPDFYRQGQFNGDSHANHGTLTQELMTRCDCIIKAVKEEVYFHQDAGDAVTAANKVLQALLVALLNFTEPDPKCKPMSTQEEVLQQLILSFIKWYIRSKRYGRGLKVFGHQPSSDSPPAQEELVMQQGDISRPLK